VGIGAAETFLFSLKAIVGKAHLITAPSAVRPFCTAFRGGAAIALAVVRPGSLLELWRVLGVCIAARKVVILQAANTGLTGGSTLGFLEDIQDGLCDVERVRPG